MRKRILVYTLAAIGLFLTACGLSATSAGISSNAEDPTSSSITTTSSGAAAVEPSISGSIVEDASSDLAEFNIEEFTSYFKRLTNYFSEPGALPEIPKAGFVLEELARSGNYEMGYYTIPRGSGSSTFECYYIPRIDIEKKAENIFNDKSTDFLDNCLNDPLIPWLKEETINDEDFILYGIVLEGYSSKLEIGNYSLVDDTLIIDAVVNTQALTYTFRVDSGGNYLFEAVELQ